MSSAALWLYARLMDALKPFMRRKLARRARLEPGYAEAIEERFGDYTQPAVASDCAKRIWIHAVSLGETRAAAVLLKALRAQYPGLRMVLTHGTATGRAEGAGLLEAGDVQVWQPWDSPGAVARFFDHFRPRLGLLMETEVWPCAVAAARARGVPLVLVNGRLSDKSLKKALCLSLISLPAYGALTAVYAQTANDALRFQALGAAVEGVFGNLKFDAAPDETQLTRGRAWRQAINVPVVMFASSREGEEAAFFKQIVLLAQSNLAGEAPDLIANGLVAVTGPARCKWLVVPRHPQRFNEVEALAGQHGLKVSRRSSWLAGPVENLDAMRADVWLGDSLGEMALYYALADAALLGGSFARLGGQNLIEAASCACPVVMGPHTFNFQEAAELAEAAGAARRVDDLHAGIAAALALARDPEALADAAVAGLAFAARHQGATDRTLAALQRFI